MCVYVSVTIKFSEQSNINKNDNKASIVKLYKDVPGETIAPQKFDPKLAWKKIARIYKGLRKFIS